MHNSTGCPFHYGHHIWRVIYDNILKDITKYLEKRVFMPICTMSTLGLVEVQLLFIMELLLISKHIVVDRKQDLACMLPGDEEVGGQEIFAE